MLTFKSATTEQQPLLEMAQAAIYRHVTLHHEMPKWMMASPGWFDVMAGAIGTGGVLVVAGVPVMCHTMLEGVTVMTRKG
jgi:hypothetical protein